MPVYYHASTNVDLEVINPRRTLSKDQYIGDYVFATANRTLAAMYLTTRGYPTLMNPDGEKPNIVICANQTEYQASDTGGAIYELLPGSFIKSPQNELSDHELVSKVSVKPLKQYTYEDSLQAMLEAGIIVRFVDKDTFNNLIGNPKQVELINQLPVFEQ